MAAWKMSTVGSSGCRRIASSCSFQRTGVSLEVGLIVFAYLVSSWLQHFLEADPDALEEFGKN